MYIAPRINSIDEKKLPIKVSADIGA